MDLIGTSTKPGSGRPGSAARERQCVFKLICAVKLFCWIGIGFYVQTQPIASAGSPRPARVLSSDALPELPQPQSVSQQAPKPAGMDADATASIHGTVVDKKGSLFQGATVELDAADPVASAHQVTTSDGDGQFNFANVAPGAFKITVTLMGFQTAIQMGMLHAGESLQTKEIVLEMKGASSEVTVTASPVEIAQAQLKIEETQRVLGVIPNFYVAYAPNALPLTPKQKYDLAWKSVIDPVTIASVVIIAGVEQATNSFSGYGQGTQGYAKRFGAGMADNFTGTFIGSAILASWWKQDPRYFYQGTGTKRSRALHAIASAVMCKGDNGHWQVDYSAIVGGLASAGISNAYYPPSDREGLELTFQNALIGTSEGAIQNLLQEFVVRRFTPRVPKYSTGTP